MDQHFQTQRERHVHIWETLVRDGEAKSADLAKVLAVSIETIRRDLKALEHKGQAVRVHGGAHSTGSDGNAHIGTRIGIDRPAKQKIGQLASQFVAAGGSVFIGAGSTALAAAWEMRRGVRASFVTNMVDVATALSVGGQDDITLLGGRFFPRTHSIVGIEAAEMIDRRTFDLAFLGASAFDTDRGLLSTTESLIQLSHAVRRRSRKVAVLATGASFGRQDRYTALPLNEIDMVITDIAPSVRDHTALDAAGVEVRY